MTVIVAKYVNLAKPDKKFGSIVTPDGSKFMLPVGLQDAFVSGQTYDVPTSQKKWGENVVTVIEGRPGAAGSTAPATPPPPPMSSDPFPLDEPMAQSNWQRPTAPPPPPVSAPGHNSARMRDDDPTARRIFVCGVTQQAAAAGSIVAPSDIEKWVVEACRVFDVHLK